MIYAYIRVSTDKQTVENQRFEIENYCRKRQIDVDQYIEETISGMKDVDKRNRIRQPATWRYRSNR